MFDLEFYKSKLLEKYKEKNDEEMYERYEHSLNVAKYSANLIKHHNLDLDVNKVQLAAILHDYAKFYSKEEFEDLILEYGLDYYILSSPSKIWHSLLGRYAVMKDFNITDEDILSAIEFHTTGKENMTLFQEVIFISDYCEEGRVGNVYDQARDLALIDLKRCIYFILDSNIKHIIDRGFTLDATTQIAFKFYKKYKNKYSENKLDNVLECINRNLVKDVNIYDLSNHNPLYDYVIISTAQSNRQMEACVSYLRDDFDIKGAEIGEGWTLIDLGDIIVHVFTSDDRLKYGLDKLYANLPIVENKIIK